MNEMKEKIKRDTSENHAIRTLKAKCNNVIKKSLHSNKLKNTIYFFPHTFCVRTLQVFIHKQHWESYTEQRV